MATEQEPNEVPAYWRSDGTLWRCSDVERDLWEVAIWVDGNEGFGIFHDRLVKQDEVAG